MAGIFFHAPLPHTGRAGPLALLAILLAGVSFPAAVLAQTAPTSEPPAVQDQTPPSATGATILRPLVIEGRARSTNGYQPVTSSTATMTDTPILDVPQVVNVVSKDVIADQDAQSLDDVLRNVSGITQTNTLGGTQDAFLKRGFGENRDGSIMTNGLRTVLPRSFNATTERVEVLKGPSTTLYGILDPGGLINVITKRPEDEFGGSASITGSSFGGGSADFDVTGPIANGFSYRMIGDYQNLDYWRNYGHTERKLIAPSLAWSDEKTRVDLSYMHNDYSAPFDRGTIFDLTTGDAVDTPRKRRFDEKYNITQGFSDLVGLGLERELSDDWKARFNYSYSRDKYSDNQARVMAYDPVTGLVTRRADATNGSNQQQHSARADLQGNIDLAGFNNEVLVGIAYDNYDLLRTDMIRCGNVPGFDIYDPTYGTLPACTNVSAADSDQTIKLKTYSTYVQDSFHLTDQWILVGGLRYQYYDHMAGKGRPFNLNTDATGGKVVPRAGIVYKATPDLSFYANYSQSFTPQSSIASFIGSLPPETGQSYEVGTKFELFKGLTGNIALYQITKQNVLYNDIVGGVTVAKTAGEVQSRGIDIDIAGQLTDRLSIIASYGLTDAEVKEDPDYAGNRPVNVARHTGSIFLAYDAGQIFGEDKFRFGGGVRGVSKRAGTQGNDYDLPAYAVADAFASYTIEYKQPVTIQLNLKNLFDETYYTSSIGTNNLGNQIGEPFQATLSMRVAF